MEKENVKVTYKHEVDNAHGSSKQLDRNVSVTPNSSLKEAVDEVGNPGRLKIQYNVGKKPESKSVQSL